VIRMDKYLSITQDRGCETRMPNDIGGHVIHQSTTAYIFNGRNTQRYEP